MERTRFPSTSSAVSCAVLAIPPSQIPSDLSQTLPLNACCYVFDDGLEVGFCSGVVLSIIDSNARALATLADSGKGKNVERESGSSSSERKKWRRIGMVQGSVSVVHQIHAFGMSKCLKLIARVIRVVEDDCGEVRVVVLVDVYFLIGDRDVVWVAVSKIRDNCCCTVSAFEVSPRILLCIFLIGFAL
ncbi:hypothetical protein Acr_15g0011910 [Actinidia rufa]|uniref:Uncharacterized protein n=1 Tax=Actinidia rufa TaxID=165716 RepID=A0A7J0FV62_9ERIC|nr:hypothetical protein Acr_15g0011910 [Actinidia rufa]